MDIVILGSLSGHYKMRLQNTCVTVAWYQVSVGGKAKQESVNSSISVSDPTFTADAVDLPISVAVVADDAETLYLATWLDVSEVTSPSKFRTINSVEETHTADGLWSGWANGSTVGAGVTYTQKNSAGTADLKLYKTYTITITAPANTLDEAGTGSGSVYAYVDGTTGIKYTHDDLDRMLASENVDIKLTRQDGSRAKFFSLGTSAVNAAAEGATTLSTKTSTDPCYSSTGYAIDDIGTGEVFHFGLYVEGDGYVESGNPVVNPNGNFTVTVISHSKSFA